MALGNGFSFGLTGQPITKSKIMYLRLEVSGDTMVLAGG
jgi:hypothetical protein